MADRIRNIILALVIGCTVAFGYRFVTDSTDAMEGTTDMSEVDLLPPTAGEKAKAYAAECDAGDGDKCSALFSLYELKRDGIYPGGLATYRRLCRKGCDRGATDLCELWQVGDKRCPMGSD